MPKLAINGGTPVRTAPFPSWPVYDETELHALERVLKSGRWGTLGGEVARFAERFARYQQVKYGVAVTNGTRTLEITLRALGVGYGDEVIVPPYTFVATVSSAILAGATPVFADTDYDTFNMDAEAVASAITPRTRAIVPVHIGGRPCDMDGIMEIAGRHNLHVVEDCAHAHGSEWKGRRVGSIGAAGSFSFQGSKNLCAGEGGFITTNDQVLYEQCWAIHNCGRDFKVTQWYQHPIVGTNARMTEWQAAILSAQMDRLDDQIQTRMENARYLDALLRELDFIAVVPPDERVTRNSYHLYLFKFLSGRCKGVTREAFCKALIAEGIPCLTGYPCLYKQGMLMTDTARRLTGSAIQYDSLYLKNVEKVNVESVWLTQNLLLGSRGDMDDIAGAILKIYENAESLL